MSTFHIRATPADHAERRDTLSARVRAAAPFAEVFEVGSTAIPGVLGKGDLDLLVRCDTVRFADLTEALDRTLAFNELQLNDSQYRGYTWSIDGIEQGSVQATIKGCPYDSFLAFRERLVEEPALIEVYNRLKRAHDGEPMETYRTHKAAFIERVLAGPEVPQPVPWECSYQKCTPSFTEATVPAGLLRDHSTKAGVWGRIVVEEGVLEYRIGPHTLELAPGIVGGIPPREVHAVRPLGSVRFHVEFLRRFQ